MSVFKRAERKHAFLKLALTGPSGSGKSYSALQLAFGLGQRIALIDTENGSASLYAHLGAFDTVELTPPFTVKKYIEAIDDAVAGGYDVLVIDSLSHAWAGEGGLLAQKESLDSRGGNSFTNWASISKQHEWLKSAILQAAVHTIVTMRSKQDYILVQGSDGKATPQKVGLAPVQREGIEFEFTVVLDIAMNHEAVSSKDRTGLFDGITSRLTRVHGVKLREWLGEQPGLIVLPQSTVVGQPEGKPTQTIAIANITDREVGGQLYSFLVGEKLVLQVPALADIQKQAIVKAGACIATGAVDTEKTVKVGRKQLPVHLAETVEAAESVLSGKEVSSNGAR